MVSSHAGGSGIFPMGWNGGPLPIHGSKVLLDDDGTTYITSDTDDEIQFVVGGTEKVQMAAALINVNEELLGGDAVGEDWTIGSAKDLILEADEGDTDASSRIQFRTDGANAANITGSDLTVAGFIDTDSALNATTSDGSTGSFRTAGGISVAKSASIGQTSWIGPAGAAGSLANGQMTLGLTINQEANDDEAFALKSSDIATGFTTYSETDTYFSLRKNSPTVGGLWMQTFATDAAGQSWLVYATGGTASTAKTTSATGLIDFLVREHDGSNGLADLAANGNAFAIRARVGGANATRFLVDEDGDLYSVTSAQTFDDYDDVALIETYDAARSGSLKGQIKAEFGKTMLMNEATLIDAGVLGDTMANGGLTNQTQLLRVLTGGVRQLNMKIDSLVDELAITKKQLAALTA
jgi:hypothetical protein